MLLAEKSTDLAPLLSEISRSSFIETFFFGANGALDDSAAFSSASSAESNSSTGF
jgi:hypothetical protein